MDSININISESSIGGTSGDTGQSAGGPGGGQSIANQNVGSNTLNITDEDMRRKMELQLHQQYAENNNANLGSTIALIVALLAVFYGYGYVYLHSTNCFYQSWQMMSGCRFTLNALLLTGVATMFVIGVLYYICFSQGIKQRMEQFITFAIRYKYYSKPSDASLYVSYKSIEDKMTYDYNRIFPKGYHPFKDLCEDCCLKRPRVLSQGLFGDLLPIISASLIIIIATMIPRIISNLNCCACHRVPIWVYIICLLLLLGFCFNVSYGVKSKINNYKKRVDEYSDKMGIVPFK